MATGGEIMTKKRILAALTMIAAAAVSVTVFGGQSNDQLSAVRSAATASQAQNVDLLERRIQRLELFERMRGSDETKEKQAQQLEGSWMLTVSAVVPPGAPVPPSRTSYASFARGGVAILSERQAAFVNPAYGSWEHQGSNEFAFTVRTDAFTATGNFLGTVKISNKITLTDQDEFVSVGQLEVRDPAGNLIFSGCATARGQRIKVEPLSEQCQGITPPQ
jgi:hypothetical protein